MMDYETRREQHKVKGWVLIAIAALGFLGYYGAHLWAL